MPNRSDMDHRRHLLESIILRSDLRHVTMDIDLEFPLAKLNDTQYRATWDINKIKIYLSWHFHIYWIFTQTVPSFVWTKSCDLSFVPRKGCRIASILSRDLSFPTPCREQCYPGQVLLASDWAWRLQLILMRAMSFHLLIWYQIYKISLLYRKKICKYIDKIKMHVDVSNGL